MTWEPTFDSGFPSQLFVKLATCAKAWVLSAASCTAGAPSPPRPPPKPPILNDAFSKPHICDCLYCAFPRNHLAQAGRLVGGQSVWDGSHQSLSDARHFPIDLLFQTLPCRTFAIQPIQEPKYFPPNCLLLSCSCSCVRAIRSYEAKNLSKTLKVAKKSISSHKLFIIIVTSTIHYATENNCKEISQDRNLVRMHMHRLSGRLPKQTICQIVFFSFCKLKWDPPCRFLVFQVEPKIYYFTDPDTMT